MEKIVIIGNHPLSGTIEVGGAKNSVLPIMAAALLKSGTTVINRAPDLRDTRTMMKLLEMMGARVKFEKHKLYIDTSFTITPEAPYDLVKTMRASFYVLGPLVSRFGKAKVSLPGGCAWGPRPVDYHLKGLEKLGASITLDEGYILAEASRLRGNRIKFDFPSVGATGNIVMAAAMAAGETKVENAACEPEIVQLCEFINNSGGKIEGAGTSTLRIEGVTDLKPIEVSVIPDRIEAGTFLIAGAALGTVTLKNINPSHLASLISVLTKCGSEFVMSEDKITVKRGEPCRAVDVITEVYPGFPTDLQAQWIALMTVADGKSVITDTIYHDRFSHIPELNRLGADIHLQNNVATVYGKPELVGAPVMSTDIRASASLIIAGLIAKGRTDISRIYHIDRGYEKIEEKFRSLGAEIGREKE
jgi:UDP-N-acetylglucosamine 1-carboxyvinyltransferase